MKNKQKSNGAEQPNGGIKLDAEDAFKLGGLLAEQRAAQEKAQALDKEIAGFLGQVAAAKGIRLEEYGLHMPTMTFVPKPAPKAIVQ